MGSMMLSRKNILRMRADILDAIRFFFKKKGYLEVQTPQIVKELAPEPYIDAFEIKRPPSDMSDKKTASFLIPSPELMMKRLLAEGFERIFQICKVFRKNESGQRHLTEFTMLEWYCSDCDYNRLMSECEELLPFCAEAAGHTSHTVTYDGWQLNMSPPFERITVRDAYLRHAGWDPFVSFDADRFDEDMTLKVEKKLPRSRPCFLLDYPAQCASLARLKPDNPLAAERVELYAGGLELANGFSELNDSQEQTLRFKNDMVLRKRLGMTCYPWPNAFLEDICKMPRCAGMALGVDRLVMLLANTQEISRTVTFSEDC